MADSWTVDAAGAGARLDKFLAEAGRLGSRGRSTEAINKGKVFVNDREAESVDGGKPLAEGDRVRVWMDRPGSAKRRPSPRRIDGLAILYEDDDVIAINKPAGILTVPLPGRDDDSVQDQVEQHLRSHKRRRPFVVHRIDRDTSGVVLFAKHAAAHAILKQQFLRQEPERLYLAVVYGRPAPPAGTWRDTLTWDARALIQKETDKRDPSGKEAVSDYRVVEQYNDTALIEVKLTTGKRNQIRIQARLRGHTLVGEQRYVYGPAELRPIDFPRQALHAGRLGVRHPSTGEPLRLDAPIPADFKKLMKELRAGH
jgi:23S rRNA pseudouridine1911/1915/1917 synthase